MNQNEAKKEIERLFEKLTPTTEEGRQTNIDVAFKMLSDRGVNLTDGDMKIGEDYVSGKITLNEMSELLMKKYKDKFEK